MQWYLVQSGLGFGYSMFLCASKKRQKIPNYLLSFLGFFLPWPLIKLCVLSTISGVQYCICYLNCQLSFTLSVVFQVCSSGQMSKTTWKTWQWAKSHCEFLENSLAASMRSCRGKSLSYASIKPNKTSSSSKYLQVSDHLIFQFFMVFPTFMKAGILWIGTAFRTKPASNIFISRLLLAPLKLLDLKWSRKGEFPALWGFSTFLD